ncbi:sodium-dependent transporter [Vandammella animalimorsus]|uniref:sodium-dependent transporter n=1 Tax=Vandammella animalimorsus TaxID=2029117 RepID=UPI00325AFD4E
MSDKNHDRQGFSSLMGFLLSVIGFAVGVGSMWRFPYVTGTNGGALFILTYMAVILLIGIPLLAAEISVGYHTRKTPINAYKMLAPDRPWYLFGYLHFIVALLVLAYTVPIYSWILTYIWRTGTAFFVGMLPEQIKDSFIALTTDHKTLFFFAFINWTLVILVVKNGLETGIERLNKILLPLLTIIMIVCIVIGLQYKGAFAGLEFLFSPNFNDFSMKSVTAAVGQAFFAIGIGMLASMVFGSYIKQQQANILRDSTIISVAIAVAGIAAGLMIFPIVFAFNLEPSAGAGLTLITLPNVFNHMALGQLVGTLFYVGFYFAAFTSAIGLCEAIVFVVMDMLGVSRKKALSIVMALTVLIGSASIMVPGFLDTIDAIASNYLLVISGFGITVFVGWVWGIDNMLEAASVTNPFLRFWLRVSVKYICPLAILLVFLGNFLG